MDGSGYPDGLAGSEVPLEARIIAVADVWDALTSDRAYRKAMCPTEAREILIAERGSKLDPECVDALLAVIDQDRPRRSDDLDQIGPVSVAAAG